MARSASQPVGCDSRNAAASPALASQRCEAPTDEFRQVAAREIEDFKRELRQRGDARDVDKLTDADILREVMNTVRQPGRLGGDLRCVVSVSMLTEGWDANTVTHVLGVRAFGTQLLCEQVVGRALRRVSCDLDRAPEDIEVEYADVLGIPYISYAASTAASAPRPPIEPTRVRAMRSRRFSASSHAMTRHRVIRHDGQSP